MNFLEKLKELISLFEKWLPDPEEAHEIVHWVESAEHLAYSFEFSEFEHIYIDRIIQMFEEQFQQRCHRSIPKPIVDCSNASYSEDTLMLELEELMQRKQTEQRTPEWYAQMSIILSASELGSLFASPRQRAKLVVSKTLPPVPRNQRLAIPSEEMNAFDWGIRFEPVVKQIYEYKYQAIVKELGRLIHPIDPRCSASPDGLVYQCGEKERIGRLIEIKCPVSREIDGIIPKDYYNQMQMQLHVTGRNECDYVEAVFSSKYNQTAIKEGPAYVHGMIALIRYAEYSNGQDFYYIYSPVNAEMDWTPDIKEGEEIVEIIPWRLLLWSEHVVKRSEEWWERMKPMMNQFWEDVEKAKRGEFVIPESTRAPKRKKEESCMIVFHKLDEEGQPIEIEGSPLKKPAIHPTILDGPDDMSLV